MHDSLKGFYGLFRRCRRPLAADGASVGLERAQATRSDRRI
jgi:hypothetical protein